MTRVEELLTDIDRVLDDNPHFVRAYVGIDEMLDSLISASRSEGVAEGAAAEREKIRRMQLCGRRVQVSQFPDDERRNLRIETDVDGVAYTLVPASVLAPTKAQP